MIKITTASHSVNEGCRIQTNEPKFVKDEQQSFDRTLGLQSSNAYKNTQRTRTTQSKKSKYRPQIDRI
jgi:hypothetical protein